MEYLLIILNSIIHKIFSRNFLYLLFFINLINNSFEVIETGASPCVKRLYNGNYIILSSSKIIFADSTLSTIIKEKEFGYEIYSLSSMQDEVGSTTAVQFNLEDGGYIIALMKKKIFIFTADGECIIEYDLNVIYPKFPYPIIPINSDGNYHYFTIAYADSGGSEQFKDLKFLKFIFNSESKVMAYSESPYFTYSNSLTFYSSICCVLMRNSTIDYIVCTISGYQMTIIALFNINDYGIVDYKVSNYIGGYSFKAALLPNVMSQGLFCSYIASEGLGCIKYDITTNEFVILKTSIVMGCSSYITGLFVEYFYETKTFIAGCLGYSTEFHLSEFSEDFRFIKLETFNNILPSTIGAVYRINIIFPSNETKYNVFTSGVSNNVYHTVQYPIEMDIDIVDAYPIQGSITNCPKYYSYDRESCLDEIPEGFYLNSTEDKTIDKCHDNCKTCDEGPTETNNNCLTCIDEGNIYLDLGNCRESCINGYFIDDNSIEKCKCTSNIKCKYCTEESNALDLCVTCNDEEGYYPKSDDEIREDGFINCYNYPEGYFLNNSVYAPCYISCKYCTKLGDSLNNECSECKSGYETKNDFDNDNNCYKVCEYYYYYDENNIYQCTENNNCPTEYSKLITAKKRCIDDCSKDNIYQSERNNECVSNLNCKDLGKYYNYEKTECINYIPEGFYCDNEDLGTIDKCHNNCKTCNEGPTETNNNCLTCKDSVNIYYDLGNCRETCINGFFTDENSIKNCKCLTNITCKYCSEESSNYNLCVTCNTDLDYYPLKNDPNNKNSFVNCYNNLTISNGIYLNKEEKQYEQCYSSCEKCNELGNENNHKCTKCKNGYSHINGNNCYLDCPYYYYFDENKVYLCTNKDRCPVAFGKLIKEKRKCINDCSLEDLYKYEFSGNCYYTCPNGTIISSNNLCVFPQQKEYCPEEYPYLISETNECSNNCSIIDWLYNLCITKNPNEKIKQGNINNIINSIQSQAIDYLLDDVIKKNGEDIVIDDKEIKYLITSSDNQNSKEYYNISTIILGECEEKIKKVYQLDEGESLLIFKADIYYEGLLSPVVIYEIYHPKTKEKLNLTHCQNVPINISVPANINEDELYKYNQSDEYYTDICSPFTTENGTDIILKDRQNQYIDNNLSVCEEGCKFTYYDYKTKKANCECLTKLDLPLISDISFDKEKLRNNFIDIKNLINLSVMKCYRKLFTKKGIIKNIGSYILLSIIFIFIINTNIFCCYEYNLMLQKIAKIFLLPKKEFDETISKYKKASNNKLIQANHNIHEKNKKISKQNINQTEHNKNDNFKKISNDSVDQPNHNDKNINTPSNYNNQTELSNNLKNKKKYRRKRKRNMHKNIEKKTNDDSSKINNAPSKRRMKLKNYSTQMVDSSVTKSTLLNSHGDRNNNKLKSNKNIVNFVTVQIFEKKPNKRKKNDNINEIEKYNDYELNTMSYEMALKYDKRTYFQYFISLLKTNHILFFTLTDDYNSKSIKICLFFFSFALYLTTNTLFCTDSKIHEIYEGNYNFIYQIPQILYSTLISSFVNILIRYFSLSQKDVLDAKSRRLEQDINNKKDNLFKCLKIKFLLFFIISFIFLILFWFYLSCFCAVYQNTQKYALKDTLLSFALSLIYPICIYLIPGIFRISSLKKKNNENLYMISKYIQLL